MVFRSLVAGVCTVCGIASVLAPVEASARPGGSVIGRGLVLRGAVPRPALQPSVHIGRAPALVTGGAAVPNFHPAHGRAGATIPPRIRSPAPAQRHRRLLRLQLRSGRCHRGGRAGRAPASSRRRGCASGGRRRGGDRPSLQLADRRRSVRSRRRTAHHGHALPQPVTPSAAAQRQRKNNRKTSRLNSR
jgi:hypothetical protein